MGKISTATLLPPAGVAGHAEKAPRLAPSSARRLRIPASAPSPTCFAPTSFITLSGRAPVAAAQRSSTSRSGARPQVGVG
ncbi:MAG: hypothetical protein ACO3EK_15615, partial [Alphaproteobacteria bacterium]